MSRFVWFAFDALNNAAYLRLLREPSRWRRAGLRAVISASERAQGVLAREG